MPVRSLATDGDGQIYVTSDPVGAEATEHAGLAFTDSRLHVTTTLSPTDVWIAGLRVTAQGALVCSDATPPATGGFTIGFSNGFDIT